MESPIAGEKLTSAELSDHLPALIMNGDRSTEGWIKLMIAFESAIAVAYGFILNNSNNALSPLARIVALLLAPMAAICGAILICRIIIRNRRWHTWFVEKFNEIPGNSGKVFADKPRIIDAKPLGHIARQVQYLTVAIVAGWLVVLAVSASTMTTPILHSPTSAAASAKLNTANKPQ